MKTERTVHLLREAISQYRLGFSPVEKQPLKRHEGVAIDLVLLLILTSMAHSTGSIRCELFALSGCLYKIVEFLHAFQLEAKE